MPVYESIETWHKDLAIAKKRAEEATSPYMRAELEKYHAWVQSQRPDFLEKIPK